jgi:excisionase family DNA binding protein
MPPLRILGWTLLLLGFAMVSAVTGSEPDGLWSTDDVAKFLGVPAATVRYWTWLGVGPKSMKIGRYRRFRRSDVERWAEARAELPEPKSYAARQKTKKSTPAKRTAKPSRK